MPLDVVTKQIDNIFSAMDPGSLGAADSQWSIEQDIKLVAGADMKAAGEAMSRLVARGNEVVPFIHEAILDDGINNTSRMLFSSILGLVAKPGSEKYIINASEISLREIDPGNSKEQRELYARVYALLSRFDDPGITIAYSNRLLGDADAGIHAHAAALTYLAQIKHKPSLRWVDQYRTTDALEMRYALMYLQSALGDESVKPDIIDILKSRPKTEKRKDFSREEYLLLLGLIEITTPEEIDEIMGGRYYRDKINISNLARLYKGDKTQRTKAADKFLQQWASDTRSSMSALEYLIEVDDATPYISQWKMRHPALIRMLEILGYVISIEKGVARFAKSKELQIPVYPDPELLSKAVVESINRNDIDVFTSSGLFDQSDFSSLIFPDEDETRQVAEYKKMKEQAISNWRKFYQSGVDAGVQWNAIRYISSEYEILVSPAGLQSTDILATFADDNEEYTMKLHGVLLYDGAWHTLFGPNSDSLVQIKK